LGESKWTFDIDKGENTWYYQSRKDPLKENVKMIVEKAYGDYTDFRIPGL
jgi:hypothetical protein